jgi:hypothetical protein
VPELSLYDDQRYAFAGHLDGVSVPKLVRGEPAPHSGCASGAPQLGARSGGWPVASTGRAVDDAEQRTDRCVASQVEPLGELFPAPCVHTDLATAPALAATNQERATALIEIAFGKSERFLDAQPGSAHDHDQSA